MTAKRLIRPVIGAAVLAAVAFGGSAAAEAATANARSAAAGPVPSAGAGPAPLTTPAGGSLPATGSPRGARPEEQYLTDHERYVRHHQRLA